MRSKIGIGILTIVLAFFLLPLLVSANTKQDIFDLVNSQTMCDGQASSLFSSYNTTYTRLVNEKELTSEEIGQVLHHLNTALKVINDNKVCSLSDAFNLTDREKNTIYNNLIEGSNIINNAKSITDNKEEEKKEPEKDKPISGVIVDRGNNTVDIYDRGILIDRIPISTDKLTYTGPSKYILPFILSFILYFIFIPIGYKLLIRNKENKAVMIVKKIYIDTCYSILFVSLLLGIPYTLYKNEIQTISNLSNLFRNIYINEQDGNRKEIVVDENNKILVYPAYGDKYATLMIPDIGVVADVTFGDSAELLRNNIGHATRSNLPGEGGSIIYSGHNNSSLLGNLGNLKKGENIIVNTSYGEFIYMVRDTKIIRDTDWHELPINKDKEVLMIYTCYPFSSIIYGSRRYVVYADLITSNWNVGDDNE